jgi:hypothetical protein
LAKKGAVEAANDVEAQVEVDVERDAVDEEEGAARHRRA